jgi:hypothetical protein
VRVILRVTPTATRDLGLYGLFASQLCFITDVCLVPKMIQKNWSSSGLGEIKTVEL